MWQPLLGTVDRNGAIRFAGSIKECRRFLFQRGLDCTATGWHGWKGNGQ